MYEKKNNDPLGEKNGGYYDLDSVKPTDKTSHYGYVHARHA